MRQFLDSIGYNGWILVALLAVPLLGAIVLWIHGAMAGNDATGRGVVVRDGTTGSASEPTTSASEELTSGTRIPVSTFPRALALVVLLLEFVLSAGLWWSYDPGGAVWQSGFVMSWIPQWGATFRLGVDGMSVMMILLTTFLMPLAVLGSWTSIRRKTHSYYALLLILTTGMLGVFMALDLVLFYVMWEVMLVPMYFIIGIWGGDRRIYASLKFFIYTMVGSLLMLVAIIWIGFAAREPMTGVISFDYDHVLQFARFSPTTALWLFGAFFLAFAVKVPMFPFHTWLPDAHVEAPTAGSVILAGIMLKMGTYGFLRFALPLFPSAAMHDTVRMVILVLAVIGIIYGALVAMVQPDFKKLVAYSSVSHLGFVMLGIFALTLQSVQGSLMVMINHGISTGALFLLIGMMYERTHTRMIAAYGGIARVVPMFASLLVLVALSSIGLPGTNGFVGEFLVLIGAFRTYPVLTVIATTGVIFAAAYLLWAIQRILFNPLDKPANAHLTDLNRRELALMVPLVVVIIWLGIYPAPVLNRMEPSAERLIELVQSRSAGQVAATPVGGR